MLPKIAKVLVYGVAAVWLLAYGCSYVWPVYDWGIRVPSPDKSYDAVVLFGDKAAFDDLFYQIYVFPKDITPRDQKAFTHVWYAGVWRGSTYLVYSGYSLPGIRWTGNHSLEINAEYWKGEPASISEFNPVKRYGWPARGEPVVVSLTYKDVGPEPASQFESPFVHPFDKSKSLRKAATAERPLNPHP